MYCLQFVIFHCRQTLLFLLTQTRPYLACQHPKSRYMTCYICLVHLDKDLLNLNM
ncbi:hypothetical protein RchiOBHm_Chr1g0335241 [Rosa chinensis]|uniref:Uncharacterized protein n=1 Tax=Rosa chinensis TaxID=74649 RepID=A0A2P6SCJ7_ROSCH|nr:hypothetical protein RchiOBHm_Chr1g0335241 [Rosa chinensis]